MSAENEIILAQEQDVQVKDNIPGKMKSVVGTLVLTDRRLLMVEANKEEELDLKMGGFTKRSATFRYADIDDLDEVTSNPNNISIRLNSIVSAVGTEGILRPPELKISWRLESGVINNAVFTEELIGGRKKGLKDWARIILGVRDGTTKIQRPTMSTPSVDSLEGKVLHVLGDMQEKGVFEIEDETETEFKVDLDPDVVESACENLASTGFLDKTIDSSGEIFYRRKSPLGNDDLSS